MRLFTEVEFVGTVGASCLDRASVKIESPFQITTARGPEVPTSIDLHRTWPITGYHIITMCLNLHSIEEHVAGKGPDIVR